MNPHIQTLFDNLKEGLMIVTPLGKVNYANAAARSIFPLTIGQTLTDEWLSRQITGIRQGYATLPVTSMMEAPSDNDLPDKIEVTLLHSPVGKDLIILAKNTSEENAYENVVSNLAEMLECEFQTPMNQFLDSVSNMLTLLENNTNGNWHLRNGNWHLRESLSTVLGMSTVLSEKLRQIGLLASTFKSSQMRGNERIFVHQIIADILTQSASLLHQRRIRVSFAGISGESPVIYGSKIFLTHALTGYLRHLVKKMEIGSNILISLKGKGGFVLLSIANDGRGHHPTKHVRQPFINTPPTKNGIPTIELSLPLCERVLELHGGSISFSQEGSDLNQITFEIPTGAPAEQSDEHGVEQAQRYAHDLHKLLQNIKQKDRGETK